ncbi:hypothetical protein ACQPWW_05420 [Micromonospora sp. CA-240977]|uniref:hypothetical protein n=1 Tax=Micromonospora sp. CA-240977 TaxID=3239957 RepID=UPI003D9244AC
MDRTLTYYAIYRSDDSRVPAGLFVLEVGYGRALLWDHRCGSWAFDPGLVMRFLNDHRNVDRYDTVDRAEAERIAVVVTGSPALPDEETFHLMLANGAAGHDVGRPVPPVAADPSGDR